MATMTKKEERKAALLAQREIKCKTPSMLEVTIRPPNIERHALSGGLPSRLRDLAAKGVQAIDDAILSVTSEADAELLTYLDGLVARTLVDPEFEPPVWESRPKHLDEDGEPVANEQGVVEKELVLVEGDKLDDYLLPADYRWVLMVAMGESDQDGEGKRLWGREPLSRWQPFPDEHGCAPDCPSCTRALNRLSLARANV